MRFNAELERCARVADCRDLPGTSAAIRELIKGDMMTDKELLEAAARAAGLEVQDPETGAHSMWNPLTDNGDALWLAVKLRISLSYGASFPNSEAGASVYATVEWRNHLGKTLRFRVAVSHEDMRPLLPVLDCERKFARYMQREERLDERWELDELSATRRAIVLAAAELGGKT